jgi:hypothetical protein
MWPLRAPKRPGSGSIRQLHRHRDTTWWSNHHQLISSLPSFSYLRICLRCACPSQWHRVSYRPTLSCLDLLFGCLVVARPWPCLVSFPCSRGSCGHSTFSHHSILIPNKCTLEYKFHYFNSYIYSFQMCHSPLQSYPADG